MSEDHQKSRGVSPCRSRAQIGPIAGSRSAVSAQSAPVGCGVLATAPPISEEKGRWLCGPQASERPVSCPLCPEGPQVRSGCRKKTADTSREDAGEMPGIRMPTVQERGSSGRLFLWLQRTLLLLLAFVVRVSTLEAQCLWRDEVDQWRFAFQPLDVLATNFTRPEWNGPLYSPVLRGWIALSGESVFSMRLLSVIWGVLTVSLVVVLTRRIIHDRRTSAVAGVLVAFSPYLVWYAQEIKMYTWVPMLVVLALYALERACRQPRLVWWAVVLVATTLAIYSHILAALLIPVLAIWFVVHPARGSRVWGGGLLVLAGLTLPYLPLLGWQAPLLLVHRQTGYPDYSLDQMIIEMASALLNGWSVGISQGAWGTPSITLAAMIALGGLVCVGAVALGLSGTRVRTQWRTAVRLLVWCGFPLLGVWVVSLRGSIFTDRYLIWSAPAFYILVAAGIAALRRLARPLGSVLIAAILILDLHGWMAQAAVPIKPAFEPAVRLVEDRREAWDLLLFQIPYNHYVFDYYSIAGLGDWAEAPYTNWREADGTYRVGVDYVGRELLNLLRGHDRVWLIASEVALWDERELVKQWLTESCVLVSVDDYPGVSVVLFGCPLRAD